MQNWRLDDILSSQSNNTRLVEGLKLLKQRATLGSLASSDDLEFAELCQFRQIYRLEIEDTITGTEPFPGEMMSPKRMNVALPDDIYNILVEYYNDAYDFEFVTIAKAATERSGDKIVVQTSTATQPMTVRLDKGVTYVTEHGREVSPSSIVPGSHVRLEFVGDGANRVVTRVVLVTPQ